MAIKAKSLFLLPIVIVMLLASACTSANTGSSSSKELVAPYLLALDEIISTDTALNANMEYISLVLNEGVPLTKPDEQAIEEYLQDKYNLRIYNYTYEQLIDQKLYEQDTTMLKGILLTIEKQNQSDDQNKMTIEVSKYRANEGAIAIEIILAYQQGQWEIIGYGQMRQS